MVPSPIYSVVVWRTRENEPCARWEVDVPWCEHRNAKGYAEREAIRQTIAVYGSDTYDAVAMWKPTTLEG